MFLTVLVSKTVFSVFNLLYILTISAQCNHGETTDFMLEKIIYSNLSVVYPWHTIFLTYWFTPLFIFNLEKSKL